jgi:hypothetical protein
MRIGALALGLVLFGAIGPGGPARAGEREEAAAAEALVRARYYEGLPFADARAITDAGAARLVELLDDPGERAIWDAVVFALGVAARPGAYEILASAAERGASGEVDRAAYRLAIALPLAMGHLARSDGRALAWLLARAESAGGDPGWWHGAHAGRALADELRRAAVRGLGVSGRPEARAALEALVAAPALRGFAAFGDLELAPVAAEARALQARVASEGADAVFAPDRGAAR